MPSEDSKAVKKEETVDDEDEKSLGSILLDRKKKANAKATSAGSQPKQSKFKKEEDLDEDEKPISRKSSNIKPKLKKEELDDDLDEPISKKNFTAKQDKQQKKKKKVKEEQKKKATKVAEQNGKKREKKVYDLPGQKRDPPEERDPLRIFYESLYEQVPGSELAQIWMMECGLLSKEEAKKVFEKKQKKNQLQKLSSPTKAIIAVKLSKQSTKSVTVKRKLPSTPDSSKKKKTADSTDASKKSKKRKIEDNSGEDESDDDFVVSKKQRTA